MSVDDKLTDDECEKILRDCYERRLKQFNENYMPYNHLIMGCFDCGDFEELEIYHKQLRRVLDKMVECGEAMVLKQYKILI